LNEFEPNKKQERLIEKTEGIYIVDAGPGTGKTFTISLRYAHILQEKNIDPEDIFLVTFTNNAAENMKERIINHTDYDKSELRDAPIATFHSFCNRILTNYGHEVPSIIGIEDRITRSTRILENEILERQEFDRFMTGFMERHPEYKHYYSIIYEKKNLLNLIKSLGAKGIFPKKDGWFRNSESYLDGNYEKFKGMFDEANEPLSGANGPKQSLLRKRLRGYQKKCFLEDAPSLKDIRGEGKKIPEEFAERCFYEDRTKLKNFLHDLYFEYIEYALSRNYLNFSFIMMFAFAMLCENHALREKLNFKYIMIDEFQDTNEIQFKLALLLSNSGNICVVGDWKQSIFSFQYASVENILDFEERLKNFKEDLNTNFQRVDYPINIQEEIKLKKNYRSTQELIDFSEQGLKVEATKGERLDKEEISSRITKLESVGKEENTEVKAYTGSDEKEVILWKITQMVDNPDYLIKEDKEERRVQYKDISVLTRTRKFGLKLLEEAKDNNVPVAYEGGIELFRTRPSILLLAWLRIVQNRYSKRGWSVILDEAGYNMTEIEKIFSEKRYPKDMWYFRDTLLEQDSIGSLAKKVFDRYSIRDAFSNKIIEVIQTTYDNTYFNRGDVINFILENIRSNHTYEVDSTVEKDVFKIQTIHSSKGLEYPVVILADMSLGGGGFSGSIDFTEPIGLRQKKVFSDERYPFLYDNWKNYVISKCIRGGYDEERRLLYVAMTRAENYLFLTAEHENESEFFKNLAEKHEFVEPNIRPSKPEKEDREELRVKVPDVHAPVKHSAHALIDISTFQNLEKSKGLEYGSKVHKFAELYAEGKKIEAKNLDEKNIKEFIDDLEGKIMTEITCLLPIESDERRLLFEGVIDLINIDGDEVNIVDYKTDIDTIALKEYRKQLSVYYHAINEVYPDKKIDAYIYYSNLDKRMRINPLSKNDIIKSVLRDKKER